MEDGYFGEPVAARYDESEAEEFQPEAVEATVDVLAELAGNGRALELGIGTGRIALPLSRRGVPVHGIDLSRAMVARLRAKSGGEAIAVTIGDFATTRVDGTAPAAEPPARPERRAVPREPDRVGVRRLRHRYPGDELFTSESAKHVSVWEKPRMNS